MELQGLQGEPQVGADPAEAEDAKKGGGAERTFQAVPAVTEQLWPQGRQQRREQSRPGWGTSAAEGLEGTDRQGVKLICGDACNQRAIGQSDGEHRHGRLQAQKLQEDQPPQQLMQ